eukprot:3891270-Prymnesium_polylepis.1
MLTSSRSAEGRMRLKARSYTIKQKCPRPTEYPQFAAALHVNRVTHATSLGEWRKGAPPWDWAASRVQAMPMNT